METAVAPTSGIIKVVVVEDNLDDGANIETALRNAGISRISYFNNYDGNVVEVAREADIVSLDFEVEGETTDSVDVAQAISHLNPYAGSFFYTRTPQEVKDNPFNFIIEKYKEAGKNFGGVSRMMMAHNRCLSILDALNDLLHSNDEFEISARLKEMQGRLYHFYDLLSSMIESFAKTDPSAARKYGQLASILVPVSKEPLTTLLHENYLATIQRPIIYRLRDELERLRGIKGVHLKDELESNVESLISKVSAGNLKHRLEEISRSYNATSFEAVDSGDEHGSGGTLGMESGGGPTTTLYLNAWFPKHPDRKRGLPVGFATDLAVNIGPVPYAQLFTGEGSDPIPVDQSHLFYSINSVDIMVMCPEARVEPICQSLNMPPGPDATVFFKIIPSKAGKFQLTVVILIHNDPIHRTSFSFDALATDQATESIRAEERVGS